MLRFEATHLKKTRALVIHIAFHFYKLQSEEWIVSHGKQFVSKEGCNRAFLLITLPEYYCRMNLSLSKFF